MSLYVTFDGTGDFASVPDDAGFSGLSDYSVVTLAALTDWTPADADTLMAHRGGAPQVSWSFVVVATTGVLRLSQSLAGTTVVNADSTAAPTVSNGDYLWVLVTRASGAGTVKFYTAPRVPGSVTPPAIGGFTQLGTDVTPAITGALHNSTSTLTIGQLTGGGATLIGNMYRSTLYSGIYGSGSETVLVDFDPTNDAAVGLTTWSDGTYTWSLNGNSTIVDDGLGSGFVPKIVML